jgi:hypothetical protein
MQERKPPAFPGPVTEHVSQAAAAAGGADPGPGQQQLEVPAPDHVARFQGDRETRPAGVAAGLADGRGQRLTGHGVDVDAGLVVVPVLVPERRLGAVSLGEPVLLRGEPGDGPRVPCGNRRSCQLPDPGSRRPRDGPRRARPGAAAGMPGVPGACGLPDCGGNVSPAARVRGGQVPAAGARRDPAQDDDARLPGRAPGASSW